MINKIIPVATAVLIILISLDIGTTWYGIHNGIAEEAHPVSIKVLETFGLEGGLVLIWCATVGMLIFGNWYILRKQLLRKTYLTILILAILVRIIVVLNGFLVVL